MTFLPILVEARQGTYTKDNIATVSCRAGLILFNSRHVLGKLPHGYFSETSLPPPVTIPKDSSYLLRHTRQVNLMLTGDGLVDWEELLDMIELLEPLGITGEKGRYLELITFQTWGGTSRLVAPTAKRHTGEGYGE